MNELFNISRPSSVGIIMTNYNKVEENVKEKEKRRKGEKRKGKRGKLDLWTENKCMNWICEPKIRCKLDFWIENKV